MEAPPLGLPTRQSLAKKQVVEDPICIRCKKEIENHEHWFFFCEKNQEVLQLLFRVLTFLFSPRSSSPIRPDWLLFDLKLAGLKGELKLGNMFIDSYFKSVYTSRNKSTAGNLANALFMFKRSCKSKMRIFRHSNEQAYSMLDRRIENLLN